MGLWRRRRAVPADSPLPDVEPPQSESGTLQPQAEMDPGSRDGAVWVKDGALSVRNPVAQGRWPSVAVEPASGVELYVNGVSCPGFAVLRAEDEVELRVAEQEGPSAVDVSISEDEMMARVTIRPAARTTVSIPDVAPGIQIQLAGVLRREVIPHGLSAADVHAALAQARVVFGIDEAAIQNALSKPGEAILVAQGRPARRGRSATVWSAVHGALHDPADAHLKTGVAPQPHVFVEVGQPLVQIVPGEVGEAGETVTGCRLPPPEVWLPQLTIGEGVLLSADGLTAIAAAAGHPDVAVASEVVSVALYAEIQLPGDVNDDTGDVVHSGHIWIGGSILHDRSVQATGSVEVRGRVVHARIEAGGSLRVQGGAAYALLVAGGAGLLYAQALPLCDQLQRALGGGSDAPPSFAARLSQARILAARLRSVLDQAEVTLDHEVAVLRPLLPAVARLASGGTEPRAASAALDELAGALDGALPVMRRVLSLPGRCIAHHIDNTRVEATGDVELGEAGAINSRVVTLGALVANGAFRGGSVLAMRGAAFVSVGSTKDVVTRIEVGERGGFRAGQVLPGTVVVRGANVRKFDSPERNVVIEE